MEKEKEENIMEKEKCCRRQVEIGGSMTGGCRGPEKATKSYPLVLSGR